MTSRSSSRFVSWTIVGLALPAACHSAELSRPPTGPHLPSLEDADEVDYPPSPARIEEVDLRAHEDDGCVWVDGCWRWNGRRWVWEPGAWVQPPADCYYAPGELFWQPSASGATVLYYRNPAWYPDSSSGAVQGCLEPRRCD
jgi:hypothetical protein